MSILSGALAAAAACAVLLPWLLARRGRAEREAGRAESAPERARLDAERAAASQRADDLDLRLRRAEDDAAARQQRLDALTAEHARLREIAARVPLLEAELHGRDDALARERALRERFEREVATLTAMQTQQQQAHAEKLDLLQQAETRLRDSFQSLAQQILDERAQRFGEQSQQQIGGLVEPLRQQLQEFRETIGRTYAAEQRERGVLAGEINTLKQLNERISQDAINLTRALKGDTQVRGAWGELVLERLLEASGLQAGREYELQPTIRDDDGGRARPDVLLRLPDDKDLVIDAKVALVAYERYVAATDDRARGLALREHLSAIRRHIDGLAARSYTDLPGLRTLDFVLMFVPVEAAFIEAVRADDGLYAYALGKNISLVSPSTLLATLRTVAHLWKVERRNINAMEIAKIAGQLHDNFATLAGELEKIGSLLDQASKAQGSAVRRLTEGGRGSVLLQVNRLAELDAQFKKPLPAMLLRQAGVTPGDATDEAGNDA